MWKWTLEYMDRFWLHIQMKGCRQRRHRGNSHCTSTCTSATRSRARNASTRSARESTQDQSILVRNRQNSWMPCMRDSRSGEVTHSRMQIVSRCLGLEPPNSISGGKRNVESLQIQTHDHWTRVEVRWILSPRGQKQPLRQTTRTRLTRWTRTTSERGPATSHQLEPVDNENVSKKARVARNVLHIRVRTV